MVLNRRAIFFSIMSVLLSSLIIIIFSSFLAESFDREALIATQKAEYVNDLVQNMDRYLGSALQRATYRGIESLVDVYVEQGPFDPNAVSSLEDLRNCLLIGEFQTPHIGSKFCFDDYASFSESLRATGPGSGVFDFIEEEFAEVTLSHEIYNISVRQIDAYLVEVNASLEVVVTTTDTSWSRYFDISEQVSLVGQTDPYWAGTPYERSIALYPGLLGSSYQASWFKNNYTRIANFSTEGWVYKDTSAASFFDVLDRNVPGSIVPGFSPYGYTSVVPGVLGGQSLYVNNQTASLAHFQVAVAPVSFSSDDLRRIDIPELNTNQTFPEKYLVDILEGSLSPELIAVAGCCDNSGCDPLCS